MYTQPMKMTTDPPATNKYRVPAETQRVRVVLYDLPVGRSKTITIYGADYRQIEAYIKELIKLDL